MLSHHGTPTVTRGNQGPNVIKGPGFLTPHPHHMDSFRVRGKRFLLTWAQCDASHYAVQQLFVAHRSPKLLIVGRERHANGDPHIHAYVEYEKSLDVKYTGFWDIDERRPNIKPKRTKREYATAKDYVKKEGDYEVFGEDTEEEEQARPKLVQRAQEEASWATFLQWGYENDVPYAYVHAAWSASTTADNTIQLGDTHSGEYTHESLRILSFDNTAKRTIILLGQSGVGKTTWAKRNMPRPCLFVSHMDDLKQFRRKYHVSIIFDDMDFTTWPRTSQIALVDFDNPRSIHVRYTVAQIPEGIYKCFTCNKYPFDYDEAIARRVELINLL